VSDIQAFGFRDGYAETLFADGVTLRVSPESPEDPIVISKCELIRDGEIVAVATGGKFWAASTSQTDFASRLGAAVDAERKVYRAYRSGKIDEAMWQDRFRMFWKVMIKCRDILGKGTVGALAEADSIEGINQGSEFG